MSGSRLRVIRKVVYRLKREFGLPITVVQQTTETVDLTTGEKSVTKTAKTVARAILLPRKAQDTFKYDIGYLKANSNFTYGGFFNDATRELIIDRKDLNGFVIEANENFAVYHNHKRYQVKSVSDFDGIAYFITLEQMESAPVEEVHVVDVNDTLEYTESGSGTDELPPTGAVFNESLGDTLTFTESATNEL